MGTGILFFFFNGLKRDSEGFKILACCLMPIGSISTILPCALSLIILQMILGDKTFPYPANYSLVAWTLFSLTHVIFRGKPFTTCLSPASEIWGCNLHMHTCRSTSWKSLRTSHKFWKNFTFWAAVKGAKLWFQKYGWRWRLFKTFLVPQSNQSYQYAILWTPPFPEFVSYNTNQWRLCFSKTGSSDF